MIGSSSKNFSFGVNVKSVSGAARRTLIANHGGGEEFQKTLTELKFNRNKGFLQIGHRGSSITAHYRPSNSKTTHRKEYTGTSNLTLGRIYRDMLKLSSRGAK